MPLRVKVCGVTHPGDARLVAQLGADAVGLNFYPLSPRYVTPEAAAAIVRTLPPFVEAVGVYVESPLEEALAQAQQLGLGAIQWHGTTPPEPPAAPIRFIPAFVIQGETDLDILRNYLAHCQALGRLPAAVLVDSRGRGHYADTGQTVPWDLLAHFPCPVPLILAGGLTPENVALAVRRVRPYAVDVASGVESAPGRKDPDKLRRFLAQARAALNDYPS